MTKQELIDQLIDLGEHPGEDDSEVAHSKADRALLEYIGDPEVTKVYDEIPKWYA